MTDRERSRLIVLGLILLAATIFVVAAYLATKRSNYVLFTTYPTFKEWK